MKSSLFGIAAFAAITLPGAIASAQTVENAYAFFDQVMTNKATEVIARDYGGIPSTSVSSECKSEMRGIFYNYNSSDVIFIDWKKVVEISENNDKNSQSKLKIIGGVSNYYYFRDGDMNPGMSGATPELKVKTGAASMDVRLTKAVNMIIDNCADKSTGF